MINDFRAKMYMNAIRANNMAINHYNMLLSDPHHREDYAHNACQLANIHNARKENIRQLTRLQGPLS